MHEGPEDTVKARHAELSERLPTVDQWADITMTKKTGPYILAVFFTFWVAVPLFAEDEIHSQEKPEESTQGLQDLDEVNRQLNNPLTSLWSLVFQNNLSSNDGEFVIESQMKDTFNFQPVLPIPVLNDKAVFISRPVVPIVSAPVLDLESPTGVDGRASGLGDIAVLSLLGPKPGNLISGLGGSFIFPTASEDSLGQGKYQAGPAGVFMSLSKKWVLGTLVQQWWSYAGDSGRPDTSQLNAQYFIFRLLPNAWQIGMSPNVLVNWKAESGNKTTFPVGFGVGKTIRIGGMPLRLLAELQYAVVHPDGYGQRWNFRFQFTPVLPSPFAK